MKIIHFPEGLEFIGKSCFSETGLKSVNFPRTLRTISQASFRKCDNLRHVSFCEGLEVLGTDEHIVDEGKWYGVFTESALESVELPSTLKRIERNAFKHCKNLKSINLPDHLEYIGKSCF